MSARSFTKSRQAAADGGITVGSKIITLDMQSRNQVILDILKLLNGFSYEEALGILDLAQSHLRETAIVNYLPESQEDIH